MLRSGFGPSVGSILKRSCAGSHINNIALFHSGIRIRQQEKRAETDSEAERRLQENANLEKLREAFGGEHQHAHLRESETEENDHIVLGKGQKFVAATATRVRPPSSHTHEHSHVGLGHTHVGVNPMLVMSKEAVKKNPGVRITWIGLAINVGLAAGKFAGGIVFHSQALVADAVHAASDMVSDFLTLISVGLASNKPTSEYPFGYGKIETVGSLAVSGILTVAGLSIGWTSLCEVVGPLVPQLAIEFFQGIFGVSTHSHSHSIVKDVTNVNAAWIAALSIVVKEWIFQATKKIATETNSNVLMANAWHHRVDSLTSLVALVTITSGYFLNIQSLDAVGGLLVSALVIKAGGQGLTNAVKELIDKSLSHKDERYLEVESALNDVLAKLVSNNNSTKSYLIKDLIVLPSGPNLRANVVLQVPLQRWENVLGIDEFELVTSHIRHLMHKEIPGLKKLNIEFVEEPTEPEEEEGNHDVEKEVAETASQSHSHSHSHSQSDAHSHSHSGQHTHKH